jgi:ligand-binding sensor domain-containing protein
MRFYRLALLTLAFCLSASLLAAPHRFRVYPNSSITILSMAQGPDGFLWLAAADGLYRFDGFHFHKIPDFPFSAARFVTFTQDGSLWAGSHEGLVRYTERFHVVLREEVLALVSIGHDVIAKLTLRDNVRVGTDGSIERFPQYARRDLMIDASGRMWFICSSPFAACSMDPKRPDVVERTPIPGDFVQVVRDTQARLWAANDSQAIAFDGGRRALEFRRHPRLRVDRSGPLLAGRNGQLWFLGETVHGIAPPIAFRDRDAYQHLEVTAGVEDARGHVWVAVQGRGLVEWIPDPNWERWFPADFGGEPPAQVVLSGSGEIVAAARNRLFRLNRHSREWIRVVTGTHEYISVFPLPDGGFLAGLRKLGVARLSPSGKVVEKLTNPFSTDDFRDFLLDRKGRLWVGHGLGLLRIEGRPGAYQLRRTEFLESHPYRYVASLELGPDGRLWAGYEQGIAYLDGNDRWHKVSADLPLKGVTSLAFGGADGTEVWVAYLGERRWIGHHGGARFSRLRQDGAEWKAQTFGAEEGYGPPTSRFLKRDSRGWIWRGSTEGIYVSDGTNTAPNDWLHIDLQSGLAAQSVGGYGLYEDKDGSMWISGDQGVTRIRPESSWFQAPSSGPAPQITRVEADGRVFLRSADISRALASLPRTLRIDIGSLQAPQLRKHAFRYRLKPAFADWRLSDNGTLAFRDLPKGSYTLEVAYTGFGKSATLTIPLGVGSAATRTVWPWVIAGAGASGALVLLIRRPGWSQQARYRVRKSLFLIRRRLFSGERSSATATQPFRNHTGQTLYGRYRLIRLISKGGFSVVYEARDLRDGNARLAVKILHAASGRESWVRHRFSQEVAALRSIEHPGVVRVVDSWISPRGAPCLAMPFLEGPTLRAALKHGALSADRVSRIVVKLGAGLAEVHRRGIVHRDVKPENIIMLQAGTDDEQPVLIDFGAAGIRGPENELAATTLLAGSFHYLAPERLTGHYSPETDVYALGVITLEMLSGKRLGDLSRMFSDKSFIEEIAEVMKPGLPSGIALAERLSTAFDPEPRRRPSDVAGWTRELAAALNPVLPP